MKSLLLFISFLFLYKSVFGQNQMNSQSANLNKNIGKVKFQTHFTTGTLQAAELQNFNYDDFLRQRDSLRLAKATDDFKKRLISIDSLIAINKSSFLDNPDLRFTVTYWESGAVDSFYIFLDNNGPLSQSEHFDEFVQQMNLTQIQYVLSHADHVTRQDGMSSSPMQFDARREFSAMRSRAGFNGNPSYLVMLLTFIRNLLRENQVKLGIASENVYEESFEPSGLNSNEKIARREKFITYVYSKI